VTLETKVLLIGGTSHAGKSTLAAHLNDALGWEVRSTDQFARHPGRPWRDDGSAVPRDVVAHFSSESNAGLLESVLWHYRENVWPIAEAVVRSHLNNSFDPCLILEGSAILPQAVGDSAFTRCRTVWLTAPDEWIRERILASSRFSERSDTEKKLIDAFGDRALAFNQVIVDGASRLGERLVDVSSSDPLPELIELARTG